MAKYRYNATDERGKWVSGEAEGEGREAVEARLRSEGLHVESLFEAEDLDGGRPRISKADAVELIAQLAALARSGLPLPSGLRAAGAEVDSPSLRAIFGDLANRVEAGDGLDDALAAGAHRLPEHLRGLILAGARSGRLADVLGEYVRTANLGSDLRRRFWSAVAYPMLSAAAVLALVVFVCNLSVRAADTLVADMPDFGMRGSPPAQAQALVTLTRHVADYWLIALVGAAAVAGAGWLLLRVTSTPGRRRRLFCGIPVVGPVLRFGALAEFCHLMAMLLEAETPLPSALELAGRGVRDADVSEACDRMARAVDAGQPLSMALRLWDTVPAGLGQLFHWSEAHRSLPESLRVAGDMFEARTRSQAGFAANVLNTFLVLLILWGVGFALASLYLPLTSMMRMLSALA